MARTRCPSCASDDTIPIVYGLPGDELIEASVRGEVALGGCCIADGDPMRVCRNCAHAFGSRRFRLDRGSV